MYGPWLLVTIWKKNFTIIFCSRTDDTWRMLYGMRPNGTDGCKTSAIFDSHRFKLRVQTLRGTGMISI